MKTHPLLATALLATLAGCADEPARYVDSRGTQTIVSIDKVDVQDFAAAADALLQSLYDSPAFANAQRKPPRIAFSEITNDTSTQFDVDQLLQKIRASVTRSGKAVISVTHGTRTDHLTREIKAANDAANGAHRTDLPDYVLMGKVLETKTRAGRTRQATYSFQLTLAQAGTGDIVWAEEKEITKQGSKAAVGW
ncbi:MAG: penicillin-binding protein activator LpoB [Puniceicoccales bacterium]|jgi:uncharacterized protein (TIGR02722 family)|nr:penicillin-binding protein activator LpoB [Puniceicoccales bacterium]